MYMICVYVFSLEDAIFLAPRCPSWWESLLAPGAPTFLALGWPYRWHFGSTSSCSPPGNEEQVHMGKVIPCLMGKSPFLMGKSTIFHGKIHIFNGKSPCLMEKTPFLMGKSTISTGPCSSSQTVSLPEGIRCSSWIGFLVGKSVNHMSVNYVQRVFWTTPLTLWPSNCDIKGQLDKPPKTDGDRPMSIGEHSLGKSCDATL